VRLLQTEVERLRSELEAKYTQIQRVTGIEDSAGQEESGNSIATNLELRARVQELEQQVADLEAELKQREVESEGFEEGIKFGISTELVTSFQSPPPTMPDTPCE
jgi:uncharacterized small protein (DUF1192 family)